MARGLPAGAGPQTKPFSRQKPGYTDDVRDGLRCLLAEALGTFVLTFVAAGALMAGVLTHGEVDHVAKSVAPALVVTALIYALGDVSGAHFNPAVTLAFALRRDFHWSRLPGYWAAQLAGAVGAALLLRYLLGTVAHVGTTQTDLSDGKTVVLEAVLTVILVTVIVNAASRHSLIGTDAAIGVGATIALCGLFAGTLTGASMNPARSFGPYVASGHADKLWLYLVGSLVGVIVAVVLSMLLHPRHDREEREAAEGESSWGGATDDSPR